MDKDFYYYATCLAARLAGMKPEESQQLAYYCQTMSEMHSGKTAITPWQYQDYQFTPCVMGAKQRERKGSEGDLLTVPHHELAFTRLPALLATTAVSAFPREKQYQTAAYGDNPISAQITRHYYNPLTDVDWQQGGRLKSVFSRKLVSRHSTICDPQPVDNIEPTVVDRNNPRGCLDSRLDCIANSQFSRDMLNDSIFKSRYYSSVKGIGLALLGCRLFVYQNTWQAAEFSKLNSDSAEQRVKLLLDAFYWSVYAIECFVQNKTLENRRQWQQSAALERNQILTEQLKALFSIKDPSLRREYMWLSQFPKLMVEHGTDEAVFTNWREGLRYRPNHLCEQAMLQSDTDLQWQIRDLQGFKESAYYKLNLAAQYQLDWLAKHLINKGLGSSVAMQNSAEQNLWQQI